MDGLSVAANVLAVVDLTAKVVTLCFQYSKAVLGAKGEIVRLQDQIERLDGVMQHARRLIESSNGKLLVTSAEAAQSLSECKDDLESLRRKLEPDAKERIMRRVGLRALKWPLNKKECESLMSRLDRYYNIITLALQIDQTSLLLNISRSLERAALATAEDTPSQSQVNVPIPEDPDFVARPAIWASLMEQYADSTRRIALVGLGGIGKSQMAIQFAYHTHAESHETSIFWIQGGTRSTFQESYRSLADTLQVPRRRDPSVDILAHVRDWLQRENMAPWLMILDNVDDFDVYFKKAEGRDSEQQFLATYLPKTGNGRILITSRNLKAAEMLCGTHKAIIEIPIMDSAEALQLLQNKLKREIDPEGAEDLVQALDFVPLAVTQSAAYINRRSPRVSVRSYLDSLANSEKRKGSLLHNDFGDLRRDEGVSNSIVVTWQVTFEQIRKENPSAANLLSLMSCFGPNKIPECMLHDYSNDGSNNATHDEDDYSEGFEDDLDVLRSYSLVQLSATASSCNMHPLVQFCTRLWLSNTNGLKHWDALFLRLSSTHFPSGAFETWPECQALLPHVQTLLNAKPVETSDIPQWTNLLTKTSWYMTMSGDYARAEKIAQTAVDVRTEMLGETHPDTLHSMHTLSTTYCCQGRWKVAEKVGVQVVEGRKAVLGREHPDTLTSLHTLAMTYWSAGQLAEAEEIGLPTMELRKATLGVNHPDTLTSMGDLALAYCNLGRWEEAEKLGKQVMEARMLVLGKGHPDTLESMTVLALTYWSQGRYEDAEKLDMQVVEMKTGQLGALHPNTLVSMANQALTYWTQGRLEESELLGVQVMEARKIVLGADHPQTLLGMANLVLVYNDRGLWNEAKKLGSEILNTYKAKLGVEHDLTLESIRNLMRICMNASLFKEAEELGVELLGTYTTKLRPDHRDAIATMDDLATIYQRQGRFKEVQAQRLEIIEARKTNLGAVHPDTLQSMLDLTTAHIHCDQLQQAQDLCSYFVEISKTELGADHWLSLEGLHTLAYLQCCQGRLEEAEALGLQVVEGRRAQKGVDTTAKLSSMANLALTYRKRGRLTEAEILALQVLDALAEMEPSSASRLHALSETTKANLALSYRGQGRAEEAEELETQIMEAVKKKIGPGHPPSLIIISDQTMMHVIEGKLDSLDKLGVLLKEVSNARLEADEGSTSGATDDSLILVYRED